MIVYYKQEVTFNKEDFSEAFWLSPQEILERIALGEFATKNLKRILELFYK